MKLFNCFKPFIVQLLVALVLVFMQVMADLQLPQYMANIVDQGIVLRDNSYILSTGFKMVLIALFGTACAVGVSFLAARIATGFSRNLRKAVFSTVESFSLHEFDKFSTASLITRSTNDIQQIQMVFILMLRIVIAAPIMGIGATVKAYQQAPSMSWIIALAVGVLLCLITIIFLIATPRFRKLQKLVDKLNLVTRQNLTGLRVIRAFNTQKVEEKKFNDVNIDLTKTNLFVNRLTVILQPMMMLIFNVTCLAIVWIGSHYIGDGTLEVGQMMAFMQYSLQVIMAFLMISIVFIMLPRAAVAMRRISEVLKTVPSIKDPPQPKRMPPVFEHGQVEFKNVTYRYPGSDEPALKDISFVAKQGQTTAIIGGTGSGKTTLVNLIPRFYDVTSGSVLVDNVDTREVSYRELRERIGYIPQKAVLFSGTIKSNIGYGVEDASKESVEQSLKVAQAYNFVEELGDTLNARVAQGGSNFSGGQKQRLAIARAIEKAPEIFIFDDSFSALDFKTDAALRKALKSVTKKSATIIVGQRISSVMTAEQIIVLDEGKMVGKGTHAELLKDCQTYREIALSQLSEKELKDNAVKPQQVQEAAV